MNYKEKLDIFLNKKSDLQKLIVIYWPTACWKTALSIKLAKLLDTEIINADSRQIYKLLDIWTWKITEEEKQGIVHYMLDILDIKQDYSVWAYKKDAKSCIEAISQKWKIPIICWWTWLYIDSLIQNFSIPEIEPDWQYRAELEELRLKNWNEYLWWLLNEVDSDYASELNQNNYRYIIRWLEIFKKTWKSKKNLKIKLPSEFEVLMINPFDWNRESLYSKINLRIDEMFDSWLVDEVKTILNMWYLWSDFGLNTIWYKEVISYIEGKININECKDLIKQHNRNYAKRQITWFKKYDNFDLSFAD